MSNPPVLFDLQARDLHRSRCLASEKRDFFLHEQALSLLDERLKEVNRTFKSPAIIGWRAENWAKTLGLSSAQCFVDQDILFPEPVTPKHDLILHLFDLHWANDPLGRLIQMKRALKPDGLMIAMFIGGESLAPLRHAFARAESDITGGISPRVSPMMDLRDAGALLQRSGYGLPVADIETLPLAYRDPVTIFQDLRNMGETNALTDRSKGFTPKRLITQVIEILKNQESPINMPIEMIFLTGWAPDESQQKPMKPGSASHRMVDFLGHELPD